MKKIKHIAAVVFILLIWSAFIGYGFVDGFLLKPLTSETNSEEFLEASKKEIDNDYVGNLAMVLIENSKVSHSYFYSQGQAVDSNTLFPVASISKWVTSFGVMKLVEQGKLDLEKPIDSYLTRWHLPKSEFDNSKVTARLLLSHSSGLIDDLGYGGFAPDEKVQTLEESLTKASDTDYSDGIAIVGYEPGSQYMYSGAGYTILQLTIEEITGMSFQDYMTQEVFEPLGMLHSTFVRAEKPNLQLAEIYKSNGSTRAMHTFTALAAASLYTTTEDMSKFMIAHIANNNVLSSKTIEMMANAQTFIGNTGVYGLGPHLFSQNSKDSKVIGHDGSGNNAINTSARLDLMSKSGIIVFETGNYRLASSLADEWLFWKAGIADFVVMQRNKTYLLTLLIVGYVVIIFLFIYFKKIEQQL